MFPPELGTIVQDLAACRNVVCGEYFDPSATLFHVGVRVVGTREPLINLTAGRARRV